MSKEYETTIAVGRSLLILNEALRVLIKPVLESKYGETWKMYLNGDGGQLEMLDSKELILTIIKNLPLFQRIFANKYKLMPFSNLIHILLRARNQWAHQSKTTPQEAIVATGCVVNVIEYICEYFSDQEIFTKLTTLLVQSEELYNSVILYQGYLIQSGQMQLTHSAYPTHQLMQPELVQVARESVPVVAEPTVRLEHRAQSNLQSKTIDADVAKGTKPLQEIRNEIQNKGYFGYLHSQYQDSPMLPAEDILEESYTEESMEF